MILYNRIIVLEYVRLVVGQFHLQRNPLRFITVQRELLQYQKCILNMHQIITSLNGKLNFEYLFGLRGYLCNYDANYSATN